MKRLVILTLVGALSLIGCESMSDGTKTGATIGAISGAVLGGVIGHQDDQHGKEGALIGGAAGALAGGLIGNKLEKRDTVVNSTDNYVSIVEVVEMTTSGVPDDVIISDIKNTNSSYDLTPEVIDYLQDNGVSTRVIGYMEST